MNNLRLKELLDSKVELYSQPKFIENDPISVPHQFSKKQDIEIAGFFAAIFAWGQRKTIINKSNELMRLMDEAPYDFVINHDDADLKSFGEFKHRTFNTTDLLYFFSFLKHHYKQYKSLEPAFTQNNTVEVEEMLMEFQRYFFSLPFSPKRTQKHIATPARNSTCKRLNMYLRWMVRKDKSGVDFGIWKKIKPSQLYIPYDVHVARIAHQLRLLKRTQKDWKAVTELTENLRKLDSEDPVKYDFALFGMGVHEKLNEK